MSPNEVVKEVRKLKSEGMSTTRAILTTAERLGVDAFAVKQAFALEDMEYYQSWCPKTGRC